jgi:hypothetical protein
MTEKRTGLYTLPFVIENVPINLYSGTDADFLSIDPQQGIDKKKELLYVTIKNWAQKWVNLEKKQK